MPTKKDDDPQATKKDDSSGTAKKDTSRETAKKDEPSEARKASDEHAQMSAEEALDWLEEDANQLRFGGGPSLERENALLVLRQQIAKSKPTKLTPVEGQPWPVTQPAAEQAEAEYARATATGNAFGEPIIEGDPYRDRAALERKHAAALGRDPEKETKKAKAESS
jgi:hypothetical protein